jgi:hypothetical protein
MDNIFDNYENWRLDQEFGPVPLVAEEPKPVQVAQTPVMPTEAPYVAKSRASMAPELEAKGIIASPTEAAQAVLVDAPLATIKGAAQAFAGLPGDIEMILRGVINMANSEEAKPKLQKFLSGLEQDTVLPTTEKIKEFLDDNSNYFKGLRNMPQQSMGEIVAPGGYIKAGKNISKGISAMTKATK